MKSHPALLAAALFALGPAPASAQAVSDDKPIGVLLAVGDIATCSNDETLSGKATAQLILGKIKKAEDDKLPVRVLALGDIAYPDGEKKSFDCFDQTWGEFKNKILPVPGNHDYRTKGGKHYRDYFAETLKELQAEKSLSHYALDFPPAPSPAAGSWRLIALNTNTSFGSKRPQVKWLEAELKRNMAVPCVLAFSHGYFYSSGAHGHLDSKKTNAPLVPLKEMRAMYTLLYRHRASLLIAGHDHHFEQLGRANASAQAADLGKAAMSADGVRSFVVGTGGKDLYSRDYKKNGPSPRPTTSTSTAS